MTKEEAFELVNSSTHIGNTALLFGYSRNSGLQFARYLQKEFDLDIRQIIKQNLIKKCKQCSEILSRRTKEFCNSSCAAKYSNQHRNYKITEEMKQRISKTLTGRKHSADRIAKSMHSRIVNGTFGFKNRVPKECKECLKSIKRSLKNPFYKKRVYKEKTITQLICENCNKQYTSKNLNKTCSHTCKNEISSKRRSEFLLKRGTSNNWTKQEVFNYKHTSIICDSKLEKAAVIYLIDTLNATRIERFTSILSFKDSNGINRRYNPDFFAVINNKSTVIEVKMEWINKKTINSYTQFLVEKQETLNQFCLQRKYIPLWLSTKDNKFKKHYQNLLKMKLL